MATTLPFEPLSLSNEMLVPQPTVDEEDQDLLWRLWDAWHTPTDEVTTHDD